MYHFAELLSKSIKILLPRLFSVFPFNIKLHLKSIYRLKQSGYIACLYISEVNRSHKGVTILHPIPTILVVLVKKKSYGRQRKKINNQAGNYTRIVLWVTSTWWRSMSVWELDVKRPKGEQVAGHHGYHKQLQLPDRKLLKSVDFIWTVTQIQTGAAGGTHIIKYLHWCRQ